MLDKISVDDLLNKIYYSGFTEGIYQIRQEIQELKSKKQRSGIDEFDNEIDYLERQLNYYLKVSEQVSNFKHELKNLKNEFDKINKEYNICNMFWAKIQDIQTFRDSGFSHKIYEEMVRSRDKKEKLADKIQKLMEKNAGLTIMMGSKKRGYEPISVALFVKQHGYDLSEINSFLTKEISFQEQKSMEEQYRLVSFGGESYLDFDKLKRTVWENNQNKEVTYVPQTISIYPLNTLNINSDRIFGDVYKRLKKINYLHQERKLKITETEYYEIVSAIKHIIKIYQDIQLLIVTKKTFENTQVNKYFELIDKEINNAHNQIAQIYDKLNKYISKLDKDNTLGIIVDKVVDGLDNAVNTVKDEIINSQTAKTGNDEITTSQANKSVENKQASQSKNDKNNVSVIEIIDSYKQRIAEAEKKVDKSLLTKAQIRYYEVYGGPKGYVASYGETFYKFLKSYYSDSENMKDIIECERLKDELAGHIYEFWKQSGSTMNFSDYAKHIQGVEINSPSSYVEKEIKKTPSQKVESYVETKEKNIEAARERYNKKNALWKLFNKKLNPANLDFDQMTNAQVEELYTGKRR